MSAPVPNCTHIKTNGIRCGSPAVKGTALCFHHSAIKTALDKVVPLENVAYGAFTPIPFVFAEDRTSVQINYFLLLQALNEQRIEKRAAEVMLRLLKAMDKNLGKSGSLVEASGEDSPSRQPRSAQKSRGEVSANPVSEEPVSTHVSSRHGAPAPAPASDEVAADRPMNAETETALKVISEISAAAPRYGYADYDEISALHPAGQRFVNLYFQKPMDR